MATRSKKPKGSTGVRGSRGSGGSRVLIIWRGVVSRAKSFVSRRPHRSFRPSKKRDYNRPLQLPGYFAFTKKVWLTFWANKKILLGLAGIYALIYIMLIGIGSQSNYESLVDSLREVGSTVMGGDFGGITEVGLIFLSVLSMGVNEASSEAQQVYLVILTLMCWLANVWLLRNIFAKRKVKLRDALYNSGAPIIPTGILALVAVVQLLPIGVATIGYSAASSTGLLSGGVEAMLFWVAAGLLTLISVYWIASTVFAMIIVTLPGTYPFKALSIAGDMVNGRRVKILMRVLWMALTVLVIWTVVLMPIIAFDSWLKSVWEQISALPIVPAFVVVLISVSAVWTATYVYMLYRAIVDEDARRAKS